MGEAEGDGRATGCAVAAPRGAFRAIPPDVGLAPLKLEHTQARTRHLMTESCFLKLRTSSRHLFPPSFISSPIPFPFSPCPLHPPFSPLPSPSPPLPSFISVPFLLPLFSLPSSPPLSFPPLVLEVGPLNRTKGFGGALCPQRGLGRTRCPSRIRIG